MDDSDGSISAGGLDELAEAIKSFELRDGASTSILKEIKGSSTEEEEKESETTSEEESDNEETIGCGVKKSERKILTARKRIDKKNPTE
jgi:hypothetical protein